MNHLELGEYLDVINELRGRGLTLMKLGADGSLILAFDQHAVPYAEPALDPPEPDEEADALFDSAD